METVGTSSQKLAKVPKVGKQVAKAKVPDQAQPKLATNQSQFLRDLFISCRKSYFYNWFILQITFNKFCWLKKWRQPRVDEGRNGKQ